MATEVFLDATYLIALASPRDQLHTRAAALAAQLDEEQTRFVTTHAVLLEFGNSLCKARYRAAAVQALTSLQLDPRVVVVPLTSELFAAAFDLFRLHRDKEWGLTDCLSFAVMRERGLLAALTADAHFEQAGFRALLGTG